VISRCQRFDFRRFTPTEIIERLQKIAKAEGVKVEEEVLYEIARHAEGSERDAESLLGQLFALGEKEIRLDEASLVLPMAYTETVLKFSEALAQNNATTAVRVLNEGVEQGMDMPSFLDNVVSLLRTVLFVKLGGLERFQEAYEENVVKRLASLTEVWSAGLLTEMIELFLSARRSARNDAIPQLSAELAALKVCRPTTTASLSSPSLEEKGVTAPSAAKTENTRELSLEEVQDGWEKMCQRLQDKNPSLLLVLKDGQIIKITGHQIEVKFDYSFHVDLVNRAKNKKNIEDILSELLGAAVVVTAVCLPPAAEADEAAAMLSEAFGGSVV
jgi:DNA polymerase-3 subunit gamma/tau